MLDAKYIVTYISYYSYFIGQKQVRREEIGNGV